MIPTRILLDTHCWLWLQVAPERFSDERLAMLARSDVTLYLSAASAWEIAIKYKLGKLPLPETPGQYVLDRMKKSGTQALPIAHEHALKVSELPAIHADPFDRLLIAQTRLEKLTLLTVDTNIETYDIPTMRPK